MARAELALVIEEAGSTSPVGQPAPAAVRNEPRASQPPAGTTQGPQKEGDRPRSKSEIQELLDTVRKIPGVGSAVELGRTVSDLVGKLGAEVKTPRERPPIEAPRTAKQSDSGASRDVDSVGRAIESVAKQSREAESSIEGLTSAISKLSNVPAPSGGRPDDDDDGGTTIIVPRIPRGIPGVPSAPRTPVPVPGGGAAGAGGAAAGTAAAGAARGLAAIAAPAAIVAAGFTVVGIAAKKVGDELDQQARRLSMFSPELAASTARADIRAMRAEMDRAKMLGPELAKFQDNYSRMNADLDRIGARIEKSFMQFINPLTKGFADIVSGLEKSSQINEKQAELIKLYGDLQVAKLTEGVEDDKRVLEEIAKTRKQIMDIQRGKDPLDDNFMDQLLATAGLGPLAKKPQAPAVRMGGGAGLRRANAGGDNWLPPFPNAGP